MVASEQDTDSDVDEAWDTMGEPKASIVIVLGKTATPAAQLSRTTNGHLCIPSNEVEERDLFSMAAEEGLDIKKTKEYDESELEDAAVKIQKVHRGQKGSKVI